MTELFVVVYEDWHIGVEAEVYSTFEKANEVLDRWVAQMARHPDSIEEHGGGAEEDCLRSVTYSCEDDRVCILRRFLDVETG